MYFILFCYALGVIYFNLNYDILELLFGDISIAVNQTWDGLEQIGDLGVQWRVYEHEPGEG